MNEEIRVGGHISRQFDQELEDVRARVLKMGGLVETQLDKALTALKDGEPSAVADVEETDDEVNKMEMLIDEECTQILARRHPAAGDLRLIIATTKSVRDLERIGDEAQKVGSLIEHAMGNDIKRKYYKGLIALAEHVKALLRATLDTYARMETRGAVRNIRMDQEIDEEYSRVLIKIVDRMKSDPDRILDALDVMWAARSLERIGDHCINICENIIYLVEGEDVRHVELDEIDEQLS